MIRAGLFCHPVRMMPQNAMLRGMLPHSVISIGKCFIAAKKWLFLSAA